MLLLIGLDDTDNIVSRGTGYQARTMASMLLEKGLARILGVTRHQHFVHSDIPYTSHNSSACIHADATDLEAVWEACAGYLSGAAAEGSDAGLALALPEKITAEVIQWAHRTKKEVVCIDEAYHHAGVAGIRLEGFTGNRQGVIGALAATALRDSGHDGRFIATGNNFHLRELLPGSYTARELLEITHADCITDLQHRPLDDPGATILVRDYLRPVLQNKKCVILVTQTDTNHDWESAGKTVIGSY